MPDVLKELQERVGKVEEKLKRTVSESRSRTLFRAAEAGCRSPRKTLG